MLGENRARAAEDKKEERGRVRENDESFLLKYFFDAGNTECRASAASSADLFSIFAIWIKSCSPGDKSIIV